MALTDFDELTGLHGSRSDAASTCLVRYFQLLKVLKRHLRPRFTSDDLDELAEASSLIYSRRAIPSDADAVIESIRSSVTTHCAKKLEDLSDVEKIAFLDAVERTANLPKNVAQMGAGPQFIL
jgi:hypothetical protein